MSASHLSRRDFIKVAGVGAGAATLACCGLGYAATQMTSSNYPTVTDTPTYTYGKSTSAEPRVLIVYATRTGSTTGVASAIGETLGSRGFRVDVKPAGKNPSVDGYPYVIVGSGINGGRWFPEAAEFVKNNQEKLGGVSVALFCVHIMNLGGDPKSTQNRLSYLDEIRSMVKPADEAFFAGLGMNPKESSWLVRWAYRTFKIGPEGDCRDWTKIKAWGQSIFA